MDDTERHAQMAGLVWAEELFESVRHSEVVTCPPTWPGSMVHARGLAASVPGARAAGVDLERLALVVQRSAAALWDVLLTWSKLDKRGEAKAALAEGEGEEEDDSSSVPGRISY